MPATTNRLTIPLSQPQAVDAVTAEWWLPAEPRGDCVLVLAHGAGSRLDHPLHRRTCAAVAEAGYATLGFNFGYAEAGRRGPDPMPRLRAAFATVAEWVRAERPDAPLVVGGRSMGGRTASLMVADGFACAGLALLNYPLLPANRRPDSEPRVAHWPLLRGPVLFVHGTRDRLFDEDVFTQSQHLLGAADVTVHRIADADHGFAVPKATGRTPAEIFAEVGTAVAQWVADSVEAVAP